MASVRTSGKRALIAVAHCTAVSPYSLSVAHRPENFPQ